MNLKSTLALTLLALMVAACSRPISPTPDSQAATPSPESSVVETPASPPPTGTPAPARDTSPLPDPASSPIETPRGAVDEVVAAAQEHLAQELGISPDEAEVRSVEAVEWPDASLGCPEKGEAYAQVVTPGYRIVLEVGEKEHELHTDETGQAIVICDLKTQSQAGPAVEYLTEELGISAGDIEILSVETYEWPDASLGCPEPGKSYAQVVTTGYRVLLRARGEEYELHTDREGQTVVQCEP